MSTNEPPDTAADLVIWVSDWVDQVISNRPLLEHHINELWSGEGSDDSPNTIALVAALCHEYYTFSAVLEFDAKLFVHIYSYIQKLGEDEYWKTHQRPMEGTF